MITPYENNWEHLSAELGYLDFLIRHEVLRWRQAFARDQQEIFKGVYISEGEIDHLLGETPAKQPAADHGRVEALQQAAANLQMEIAHRKRISLEQGVYLALPHLARLFGLAPFEEQVILVCLAPELNLKYEKLYAYLQDDMTRKRPSVDLVMRLLCPTPQERLQGRAFFSPQAPLFRSQILQYVDSAESHLPARFLKLDNTAVNFLLGIGGVDKELAACIRFVASRHDLQSLRWPESLKSQLLNMAINHLRKAQLSPRKLIYHFYGPYGAGKKSLAAGLCREIGAPLLVADLREVLLRAQSFEEALRAIFRQGILQPAAIYLENVEPLLGDDDKALSYRQSMARCLDEFSWLAFIATEKMWAPAGLFKNHFYVSIELPAPDMITRKQLWTELAAGNDLIAAEVDWDDLAAKFRLTPGQMQDALIAARNLAQLRASSKALAGENTKIGMDDLYRGCRAQSNQKLAALARKLTPHYSWPDIILPPNALAQLRELCAQVKHRQTVYGSWGFGHKLSQGKGLTALFHGPSGAGKTMAAEIIANELHLEAYKIDLSTVVSKYIGETEKNLSKIFQEAETSNAILFFDEADALFGKRSEVKDAHDRYANIEINYLLQRMEEFEGLAILATNLRKNIDEAFFRRMHFAVEFPFPDEAQRYQIWQQHFPPPAPLADDIDFNYLANRFNVTGGHIKNIVINAAFLAAENSGMIHMAHLIRATKREYEKMGRLCTDAEFAPYQSLLKET
jgi:SpoVK/Ycf46/Vps4 family AAA+-type ATPase